MPNTNESKKEKDSEKLESSKEFSERRIETIPERPESSSDFFEQNLNNPVPEIDRNPWWIDYTNLELVTPPSNISNRVDISMNSPKAKGGAFLKRVITFANADATPSVKNANICITTGTTAITAFDDGKAGQIITIKATANITITNGANLNLAGAGNFAMTADDVLTLCMFVAGTWHEVSRSVN